MDELDVEVSKDVENPKDDRRATIEAAFTTEAAKDEQQLDSQTQKAPVSEDKNVEVSSSASKQGSNAEDKSSDEPSESASIDKPPQSWRAAQKIQWGSLPADVRQEVVRREREMAKAFGENATARQTYTQLQQVVAPYAQRLQSMGAHPLAAVKALLDSDHLLSTAPVQQRAQFMAKLIKDYKVDINELDAALAGGVASDPTISRVEQLLQERLSPLQTFLSKQIQKEQLAEQQSTQELAQTVERMADDTDTYPYFEDVREDMADLVDLSAKRGVYITLQQAYNRAIAMNPEISSQVATQQVAEAKKTAAQTANARAQRALNASSSVNGSPSGSVARSPAANDRRSNIAAAFEALERS